jgi:hypothetical protein
MTCMILPPPTRRTSSRYYIENTFCIENTLFAENKF